jgi:hypothetical protein
MADDIEIQKVDEDRQLVFGWANVAIRKDGNQVVDSQGDSIDAEDLEDAAYLFNLSFRKSGEMHRGDSKGDLVESFVVTPAKLKALGLEGDALPLGWWVGFKVHDKDVFAKVKAGDYRMFSIQGKAKRVDIVTKADEDEIAKAEKEMDDDIDAMEQAIAGLKRKKKPKKKSEDADGE